MKPLFTTILCINIVSLVSLLTIDSIFPELWSLAVLIYIWAILNLFIFSPLTFVLMSITKYRIKISILPMIANIAVSVALGILVNHSNSIDALMSV